MKFESYCAPKNIRRCHTTSSRLGELAPG